MKKLASKISKTIIILISLLLILVVVLNVVSVKAESSSIKYDHLEHCVHSQTECQKIIKKIKFGGLT